MTVLLFSDPISKVALPLEASSVLLPTAKNELLSGAISAFSAIFRKRSQNPSAAETYTGTSAREMNEVKLKFFMLSAIFPFPSM